MELDLFNVSSSPSISTPGRAKHEVHAPLVVQEDVPAGVAGLPGADARVEVEPLPRGPAAPARHDGQHVHIDVVHAARGDDLGRLGPVLAVGAHLAAEVVVRRGGLASDHGRVVFQVLLDVRQHLAAVPHVVLLGPGEEEAQAPVITAAVAPDVLDIVTGQLRRRDKVILKQAKVGPQPEKGTVKKSRLFFLICEIYAVSLDIP